MWRCCKLVRKAGLSEEPAHWPWERPYLGTLHIQNVLARPLRAHSVGAGAGPPPRAQPCMLCKVTAQGRPGWCVSDPHQEVLVCLLGFPLGMVAVPVLPGKCPGKAPGGQAEVWKAEGAWPVHPPQAWARGPTSPSQGGGGKLSLASGLLGEPSSVHLGTVADLVSQTDNH